MGSSRPMQYPGQALCRRVERGKPKKKHPSQCTCLSTPAIGQVHGRIGLADGERALPRFFLIPRRASPRSNTASVKGFC